MLRRPQNNLQSYWLSHVSPRLFLDDFAMVFLGWLYGLDKELTDSDGDTASFHEVRRRHASNRTIISASWRAAATAAAPSVNNDGTYGTEWMNSQ